MKNIWGGILGTLIVIWMGLMTYWIIDLYAYLERHTQIILKMLQVIATEM